MRSFLLALSALVCFGGGAIASRALMATSGGNPAYVFLPRLAEVHTPPPSVLLAGSILSVDTASRTITLQVPDPYAPATTLLMRLQYDERTQFAVSSYASHVKQVATDLKSGTRVLAIVSRSSGMLRVIGISTSKQYE